PRRLDDAPYLHRGLSGAYARLPLPAGEGQLDRGRHVGDPAQHHRRAGAGPAPGATLRCGRRLEGPAEMKLLLDTPLEADLRAGVRAMLADRCPPQRVLAGVESAEAYDQALWRTLAAEMGLAGLLIPERYGGAGAGPREAAVVCEELGRAVAPVPYLGSAVVAAAVLLAADTRAPLAADDRELLGDLAAGTRVAALAVPYSTPPFSAGVVASVTDRSLTGTVRGIADALGADILLVPAADGLYAVDAGAPGVERVAVASLDLTRPL